MYRKLTRSLAYFLLLTLGACVGTIAPRPWFEGDKDWPSITRFKVEGNGTQQNGEIGISINCADESGLWIYLYARSQRGYNDAASILYSTQNAYIEKENGDRVISDSDFYVIRSSKTQDASSNLCSGTTSSAGSRPAEAYSVVRVENENLNRDQGGVILRFGTTLPVRDSRWTLHLGELIIGDVKIEIPEKIIILRDREWYTRPFQ